MHSSSRDLIRFCKILILCSFSMKLLIVKQLNKQLNCNVNAIISQTHFAACTRRKLYTAKTVGFWEGYYVHSIFRLVFPLV